MNDWETARIARSISEKAFEHVIGPIDNKINELLRAGYANTLSLLGVSPSILAAGSCEFHRFLFQYCQPDIQDDKPARSATG